MSLTCLTVLDVYCVHVICKEWGRERKRERDREVPPSLLGGDVGVSEEFLIN
jgi:hypothetical protein